MTGRRVRGVIEVLVALAGLLVVFILWALWLGLLLEASFKIDDLILAVVTIPLFLFGIVTMVILLISGLDDLVRT